MNIFFITVNILELPLFRPLFFPDSGLLICHITPTNDYSYCPTLLFLCVLCNISHIAKHTYLNTELKFNYRPIIIIVHEPQR